MAGRGPAPKAGAVRTRPTLHTIPGDGYSGPYPPLEGIHTPGTHKWYETWAHSPQANAFEVTDWQRLQQLAYVVDELYSPTLDFRDKPISSPVAVLSELRQQEKLFGATLLDRASLYMTITEPESAAEETSVPVAQATRRDRLRAVGD